MLNLSPILKFGKLDSISLLVKVRLNKNRSQGARIESVP